MAQRVTAWVGWVWFAAFAILLVVLNLLAQFVSLPGARGRGGARSTMTDPTDRHHEERR